MNLHAVPLGCSQGFGAMNRPGFVGTRGNKRPSRSDMCISIPVQASWTHHSATMRLTKHVPFYSSCLARAYADLGKFDRAWHCIGEAMTAVETGKERWFKAEVHRTAGEIARFRRR